MPPYLENFEFPPPSSSYPARDPLDAEENEIPQDLFTKLFQCGIIAPSKSIKVNKEKNTIKLGRVDIIRFLNGSVIAAYSIVLTERLHGIGKKTEVNDEELRPLVTRNNIKESQLANKP